MLNWYICATDIDVVKNFAVIKIKIQKTDNFLFLKLHVMSIQRILHCDLSRGRKIAKNLV